MNYADTLSQMVDKSGLTLKDLSEKCTVLGVKVAPSYISKLKTNKQPPASDEVNIALAKACGQEPDLLLFKAYVEKAPEIVKEFLEKITIYFRNTTKFTIEMLYPENQSMIEKIDQMSDLEIIRDFIKQNDELVTDEEDNLSLKDGETGEVKLVVNPKKDFEMLDKSMEPRLPKGAQLNIQDASYIEPGDIVIAELSDGNYIVRRFISVEGKIALISENLEYKSYLFNDEDVKFLGKVKSVTTTL
ncbi:LexA family transcriptional regulator [Brevibacillus brevis]|uniref:LexA family transcriptional regulator n=1 Tax=Brevibacillus brevis TaxID=1393 RepID=UPI0025A66AE4|nr:LexA family transcriptional regulator [Brevibacillus brevis]WJQ82602.1 LexA family transcriptional regulator [Brevibacillus brevis]